MCSVNGQLKQREAIGSEMMRVLMSMTLLAAVFLLAGTLPTLAQTVWKTLPFDAQCKEVEAGNADEGQDYIFRKCDGPVPAWLLYQEGVRLSVGFGTSPHVSLQYVETGRPGDWPVQWGGSMKGGKFVPRVAIVRFKSLEQPRTSLFVFRLLENGTSCIVGTAEAGANQNAKAKEIAEKAMTKWKCLSEPVPVTS